MAAHRTGGPNPAKAHATYRSGGKTRPKGQVTHWATGRRPPHIETCQCESCQRARQALVDAIVRFREWRKGQTTDLGDTWDIASHRLARFISTTRVVRAHGKPGTPDIKMAWVHHLDEFSLNRAVDRLGAEYPVHGRIIVQYFYNDKTQEEIAEKEHMDQSTVSRYLKAAVAHLGVVYEGLTEDPILLTPAG